MTQVRMTVCDGPSLGETSATNDPKRTTNTTKSRMLAVPAILCLPIHLAAIFLFSNILYRKFPNSKTHILHGLSKATSIKRLIEKESCTAESVDFGISYFWKKNARVRINLKIPWHTIRLNVPHIWSINTIEGPIPLLFALPLAISRIFATFHFKLIWQFQNSKQQLSWGQSRGTSTKVW